ncbi:hypothetical protein LCGC14_0346140 [marine sediment metagenome]|uniref:Uncharacterized protein n=1 Tax=marine sediment metagenome TaxID=412755 RepID=A0A0F9TV73_9ZZZZ
MKYIPKYNDRFKVYVITRTERPVGTNHERYVKSPKARHFGHPAQNCTNCRDAVKMGNELVFKDDLGVERTFVIPEIVCEKV